MQRIQINHSLADFSKKSLLLSKHCCFCLIIRPAQHSNTTSTNRVNRFDQPIIDSEGVEVFGKLLKTFIIFLFDELAMQKFT